MNANLILQILIAILVGLGLRLIYKMSQAQSAAHDGYEKLADDLAASYTKESNGFPPLLADSILAKVEGLLSDIITGTVDVTPFVITNAALGEASQISDVDYAIAAVQTNGSFPHFLVVPHSVSFLYSPLELRREHNLQPAELQNSGVQVYVAAGYELEALQILTPAVLEELKAHQSVIEGIGNHLIVIKPHYANPEHYTEILAEALSTAGTMKGLDRAITPVGDLPLTLHPSRSGELTVGLLRTLLIFGGSIAALAVLTLCIGLIVMQFKK